MLKSLLQVLIKASSICGTLYLFGIWYQPNNPTTGIAATVLFLALFLGFFATDARLVNSTEEKIQSLLNSESLKNFKIWWSHFVKWFLYSSCIFMPFIIFNAAIMVEFGWIPSEDILKAFLTHLTLWICLSGIFSLPPGNNDPNYFDYFDEKEIKKNLERAQRYNFFGLVIYLLKKLSEIFWGILDGLVWLLWGVFDLLGLICSDSSTTYSLCLLVGTASGYFYFNDPFLGFLYGGIGAFWYNVSFLEKKVKEIRETEVAETKEEPGKYEVVIEHPDHLCWWWRYF